MSEPTRGRKDLLADGPVNEMRAQLYHRLIEAQERIAHTLYARGVEDDVVSNALDWAEEQLSEAEQREDLYLSSLAHYVEALGGRLEVRAVFDDEATIVWSQPTKDP